MDMRARSGRYPWICVRAVVSNHDMPVRMVVSNHDMPVRTVVSNHGYVCAVVSNHGYVCARWSVTMDIHESYNKLVIARAVRVPHVGYWHGSDIKPSGLRLSGSMSVRPEVLGLCQCGPKALRHYHANNLYVALEPVQ